MAWRTLEVTVSAEHAEPLSEALLERGASSVSIEDAAAGTAHEAALYGEPGPVPQQSWPASLVSALFAPDTDVARTLACCAERLELDSIPPHRVRDVAEQDWVRLTQSQFKPIPIGKRLWIVPSWHASPDPYAIAITLDPGLAFGTGSHPTTRLCLEWLEANVRGGETVLDYGCGSGILAIAAVKLGARRAHGIDIDQQAILAATQNAKQNGVDIEFGGADGRAGLGTDIVVANILANPLKIIAPILAKHCRPGGVLLLSGILDAQSDDVIAAYRDHFALAIAAAAEGWVLLAGTRRC
jgi:ribosomal protein L11 methyltransferase